MSLGVVGNVADPGSIRFSSAFLDQAHPAIVQIDRSAASGPLHILGAVVTINIGSWPGGQWRIIGGDSTHGWTAEHIGEIDAPPSST